MSLSMEEAAIRNETAQLQAWMADVQSKQYLPWLNKDLAYSNLPDDRIHELLKIQDTLQLLMYGIAKLHLHENGKLPEDPMQLVKQYSSLQFLVNKSASIAVIYQSKKGWARELTVTQKNKSEISEKKKKFFGLRGGDEDG